LGCYFKRLKNFEKALLNFEQAIKIINQNKVDNYEVGITYLNIGAVLTLKNE
jgi:tetratricopeptide (TPR) repeat protein